MTLQTSKLISDMSYQLYDYPLSIVFPATHRYINIPYYNSQYNLQ